MILPENTTVDTSDATVMATYGLVAFTGNQRPIVQNLGPGTLYLGTGTSSLNTVGLKLPTNAVYELPADLVTGPGRICLLAMDDDCDVRIINVG
jgi:hypothetical protein